MQRIWLVDGVHTNADGAVTGGWAWPGHWRQEMGANGGGIGEGRREKELGLEYSEKSEGQNMFDLYGTYIKWLIEGTLYVTNVIYKDSCYGDMTTPTHKKDNQLYCHYYYWRNCSHHHTWVWSSLDTAINRQWWSCDSHMTIATHTMSLVILFLSSNSFKSSSGLFLSKIIRKLNE